MKKEAEKQCPICLGYFTPTHHRHVYCSDECKKFAHNDNVKAYQQRQKVKKANQKRAVLHTANYEQKMQTCHLHLKFYQANESEREIVELFERLKAEKRLKSFIKELTLDYLRKSELNNERK